MIDKIGAILPEELRGFALQPSVGPKPSLDFPEESVDPAVFRSAIREGRKLRLRYRDRDHALSARTVWPVVLGYAEDDRMLIAWCELRADFRHFRTDRIVAAELLDAPFGESPATLRQRWQAWRLAELGQ